jgi:hypothetical protein
MSGAQIAAALGMARSTVGLVLRRLGLGRPAALDPKPPIVYERPRRAAYTEILPSLGQEDATAFLERALAWYARLGVNVERVMTDNGSAYRSKRFAAALGTACEPGPIPRAPTARPNASS